MKKRNHRARMAGYNRIRIRNASRLIMLLAVCGSIRTRSNKR